MVKTLETNARDPLDTESPSEGFDSDSVWATQMVEAQSFKSNAKGTQFQPVGRHVFEDVERAGPLRVGSAWGLPGILAENDTDIVVGVNNGYAAHIGAFGSGRHASVYPNGSLRVRGHAEVEGLKFPNGWTLKPNRHDLCFENPNGVKFCLTERLPPFPSPWLIKPMDEQVNLLKR